MGSQKVRHNLVTFTFLTTKSLCNPMYSRPPGSSVHGRLQAEYWSGKPFPPPGDLPNPGIEPGSPASQADSSPSSHQRSPETGGCPPEPLLPSVHHGRTGVRHVLYFSASLVIRPWGLRPHPQPCCVQVWPWDLSGASSVLSSFPRSWYLNLMVRQCRTKNEETVLEAGGARALIWARSDGAARWPGLPKQRLEWCCYKPRGAWSHKKLEEVRKDFSLKFSKGKWSCQHLDFRCLPVRTGREHIQLF